jgi:hypothetical protein
MVCDALPLLLLLLLLRPCQGPGGFMFQLPEAKKLLHNLLMQQDWWVAGK